MFYIFFQTTKQKIFILSPHRLMVPTPFRKKQEQKYELVAVINQIGKRVDTGHYTAFVKKEDGIWYCFNDGHVSKCSTDGLVVSV